VREVATAVKVADVFPVADRCAVNRLSVVRAF
jgi:hypothetical protein